MAHDQSPSAENLPPTYSASTRVLTLVLSMAAFAGLGALVGNRLGKLGEKNGHSQAQRLLTLSGGMTGGLLALASQPDSPVRQAEVATAKREAQEEVLKAMAPELRADPSATIQRDEAQAEGTLVKREQREIA